MLAPSRNTTEQRYQTNALTLESISGYLFSRWKHRLDASAREQVKAWTESKLLPADVCSPGGLWEPAPLSLSLPGRPERRVFLSLSSSGPTGDITAKDTAKDSLGSSFSSLHQPQQGISTAWQARGRVGASPSCFLKPNKQARRVKPSNQPFKPTSASANDFPGLPSWGHVRASPCFFFSSPTTEQDASKPRNKPSLLRHLRTCFSLSQVMTWPSSSLPSCSTKLNTLEKLQDDGRDIHDLQKTNGTRTTFLSSPHQAEQPLLS